jgi:hypothetical protein
MRPAADNTTLTSRHHGGEIDAPLETSAALAADTEDDRVMAETGAQSASWRRTRLAIATLMVCETAALTLVSLVHFGVELRLGGMTVHDPFGGAAVPEAIIAAALACGALSVVTRRPAAWRVALGTTVFAVIGFIVGLRFTVLGAPPLRVGDVVYHVTGLTVLLLTTALLLSSAGRCALRRES